MLSKVNIGDIILTPGTAQNVYVYFGKYVEYSRGKVIGPAKHLYCFLGPLCQTEAAKCISNQELALDRVLRLVMRSNTTSSFGRFTVRPISYVEKLGHINLSQINEYITDMYSLRVRKEGWGR